MSNLPPPSLGGPPNQPGPPTVAFTPPPPIAAPAKKHGKLPYLIAGAVIVAAALVVAAIAVFGGSSSGGGNIAGKKAAGAVEDATNAARVPRDAPGVVLSMCPFDGVDTLADKAPDGFDASTAADSDIQAVVRQTSKRTDPELLECVTGDETLRYGVLAAGLPPADVQAYIDRSLTDATGKFEDTEKFRGGTLLPFCTTPTAGSGRQVICATAWYDSQLMVGLFVSGAGASSDITTAWLKTELSPLVKELEQSRTDVSVADTGTTGDTTGETTGDTAVTETTG